MKNKISFLAAILVAGSSMAHAAPIDVTATADQITKKMDLQTKGADTLNGKVAFGYWTGTGKSGAPCSAVISRLTGEDGYMLEVEMSEGDKGITDDFLTVGSGYKKDHSKVLKVRESSNQIDVKTRFNPGGDFQGKFLLLFEPGYFLEKTNQRLTVDLDDSGQVTSIFYATAMGLAGIDYDSITCSDLVRHSELN